MFPPTLNSEHFSSFKYYLKSCLWLHNSLKWIFEPLIFFLDPLDYFTFFTTMNSSLMSILALISLTMYLMTSWGEIIFLKQDCLWLAPQDRWQEAEFNSVARGTFNSAVDYIGMGKTGHHLFRKMSPEAEWLTHRIEYCTGRGVWTR